jgi:signal transduction histidine kinase
MDAWHLDLADDGSSLAADALDVGLALCAPDGRLRRRNAALENLLGAVPPDAPDALAGTLLAAGVTAARELLAAALDAPQDLRLRRGGRAVPVRLRGHVLRGGNVLYLLHVLREADAERARSAELQSLIAHDLRSPLAVIQGYAGLLATGQPGPLNATQAEFLAGIDTKIVEVTRLLDDFLDLGRLEAGALELQPERIVLAELAERVAEEQRRGAASRRVSLTVSVVPENLVLTADPLRLKQVIENLVGNAVKYNREGGWVRVEARARAGDVEIRVSDGGPGIEAADLATVFEPFHRAAAGHGISGSGLGLAVVQRLVHLHGGEIGVASMPGRDTTFTLRLPVLTGDALAPSGAAQ